MVLGFTDGLHLNQLLHFPILSFLRHISWHYSEQMAPGPQSSFLKITSFGCAESSSLPGPSLTVVRGGCSSLYSVGLLIVMASRCRARAPGAQASVAVALV